MSYIYSQALVAEYSAANCSDTAASALLNANPTPKLSWWHDKTMEPSRHSRFGMTYAPLTESLGAELLTWFAGDSLVRTLALQETVPGLMESDPASGQKWQGSLAKYDPATHSLKTAQLSLIEDLTRCCVTLPRWGLMRNGELYQQQMLVPHINENESGFWPTPTTQDNIQIRGQGAAENAPKRGTTLAGAVKIWPTATASAHKGWAPNHNRANTDDRLDYTVERESFQPGQQTPPMRLNPEWVEWLMGWPIGHTALKPLATGRLAEWRQQHSPFWQDDRYAA